jgi:hypothetical protein
VKPDYALEASEVFMDLARRVYTTQRTLNLLESCELASRTLDIPSWVPDWSRVTKYTRFINSYWSACGFISPLSSFNVSGLQCTVSGVQIACLSEVTEKPTDECREWMDVLLPFLRALKPPEEDMVSLYRTGQSLTEVYCRVLIGNEFADSTLPQTTALPDFAQAFASLRFIWSKGSHLEDLSKSEDIDAQNGLQAYLEAARDALVGRCFFRATDSYIGLAPIGSKVGDIVCVLFGCGYPMILRPVVDTNSTRTWLVVGVCYVHGLMNGEAIYRKKNLNKHKPLWLHDGDADLIDAFPMALYDTETSVLKTDPAAILEDAGIKVERYQRHPHELIVLPETLRAAGIAVEDFMLV